LLGDLAGPKQVKRWRKEIRQVTEGLGHARDKDVQIDFLCQALTDVEDPQCCSGIAHLLMHLEYQREMLQPRVVEAVERLEASKVVEDIRRTAEQAQAESGEADVRTPALATHCREHILERLEALLADEECLRQPDEQDRHHAMRIAAKRLRYTLEIAAPVFQDRLEEAISRIKKVQTLLGEIHDCDVWVAHLDAFSEEERRRMSACFGSSRPFERVKIGLEYLRKNRRKARRAVFEELGELWQVLRSQGIWDRLAATVRGETAAASSCPPPAAASGAEESTANGDGELGPNGDTTRHLRPEQPARTQEPESVAGRVAGT
jgi:CHAD domain-containing protein